MITGVMNVPVKLTGTGLALKAGTIVKLTPATNVPVTSGVWFASPLTPDAGWLGGDEDSILINSADVAVCDG
jgi:hypothetical protein